MKNENKSWMKYLTIVILILAVTMSGCEKDNDPVAPDLPPLSTLVMDLTEFVDQKSMPVDNGAKAVVSNWGHAAGNVVFWNTVLTVNLIVPVASFYEAFNHEGIYEGNNEWVWSYNFMAGGASYKAELHGFLQTDTILWKMYISKENVFQNFLWYSGTHNLQRTAGQWILYKSPESQISYLQIDWTRSATDDTGNIKYEIIDDGDDNYESYIDYGRTNGTPFDRYYDIYLSQIQNLVEIEWSKTTKEGRVKDYYFFEDMLWHCWDNLGQNTDCN